MHTTHMNTISCAVWQHTVCCGLKAAAPAARSQDPHASQTTTLNTSCRPHTPSQKDSIAQTRTLRRYADSFAVLWRGTAGHPATRGDPEHATTPLLLLEKQADVWEVPPTSRKFPVKPHTAQYCSSNSTAQRHSRQDNSQDDAHPHVVFILLGCQGCTRCPSSAPSAHCLSGHSACTCCHSTSHNACSAQQTEQAPPPPLKASPCPSLASVSCMAKR